MHMVRLAHDGTDEAPRGSAILSHIRPFHRKAGVLRPPSPNARQYHVAEQATRASPVPDGVATRRQDVPFQISARFCGAPCAPKAVPTARHQVGRTQDTPARATGLAVPAAWAGPASPIPPASTARPMPAAVALRLILASKENPVPISPSRANEPSSSAARKFWRRNGLTPKSGTWFTCGS